MENDNKTTEKINWAVKIGFLVILSLPVLVVPPWIFPPDWGKTIIFRSVLSIVLFLLFYSLVYKKGYKFSDFLKVSGLKKSVIFWLLAVLALLFLLSSIFSKDVLFSFFSSPLRGGGSVNFIFYIIFSITAFLIFKERDWQKAWKLSIFVGCLVALIAVFQFYGLFKNAFIPYESRPPSVIGGAIFLATYLLLLSFIALSSLIKEKNVHTKIFCGVSLILFLYVILLTGSRAAFLGLALGGLFFLLFYPKKSKILKVAAILLLALGVFGVYYVNYGNKDSKFLNYLENNKITQEVLKRLSISLLLVDPRLSVGKVSFEAAKARPILGYGPENFGIAFDKYYDPSLSSITKNWGSWYDRAHNVLLDTAVTEGIPAAMVYISIFVVLFWQLQKNKRKPENTNDQIMFHGAQATLIAYFVNNFFSFDTFSSYIIFFLLIAYSLCLINKCQLAAASQIQKNIGGGKKIKAATFILFLILILFLWQYNIKPFLINIQINIADDFMSNKDCAGAFQKLEKTLPQHSFLDSYLRLRYVGFLQKCAETNPQNSVPYAQKGIELLKESIKIRPLYSRSWIFLGGFTTVIANSEKDQAKKEEMLLEAKGYLKKAAELAPNHQETILEEAKIEMVSKNYKNMKEKAEKCILLDPSLGDCYWMKALSEIYLKDFDNARLDIKIADEKRFNTNSISSLYYLVNAYAAIEDYKNLASTYEELVKIDPKVAQYHASLAFAYSETGEYKKAREEASKFLQLMPEAKDEVGAFLKTLPY